MKEVLESDLKNGFNFYPSSAFDFGKIENIEENWFSLSSCYVFCDVGDIPKDYGMTPPMNFLENKLGLSGFEIISKTEIHDFLDLTDPSWIDSLKLHYGSKYAEFCATIHNREVTRYEIVRYWEDKTVLYFFRYDALTVLQYLLAIQDSVIDMLILQSPQGGWLAQNDYLEMMMRVFRNANKLPSQLLSLDSELWKDDFTHPEYFGEINGRVHVERINSRIETLCMENDKFVADMDYYLERSWFKPSPFILKLHNAYKIGF